MTLAATGSPDLAALRSVVRVDERLAERQAHARDLWPRGTLKLASEHDPGVPPLAVAFPTSEAEVAACVQFAAERGIPLVPWGAGSGVCGAAAGRADAVALDLKLLRDIGPVQDRGDHGVVDVGAGVLGQHLEDALQVQGWATRHSPSSIWCSTVGGWAVGRSAGQFSSKYGKFEDMALGLRVVAPAGSFGTGEWFDPANRVSAGRDLHEWVLGSEGALGVVTQVRTRVVRLAEARWLRGYRFKTPDAAWTAMRHVLQADLTPCAVRLYDAVDTKLAGKGTVGKVKKDAAWLAALREQVEGTPSLRRHTLALPLSLPRLVNGIVQGISGDCVLILGFEGRGDEVAASSAKGHAIVLAGGGVDLGAEPGEHWYEHRHEVSYKVSPIYSHGGFADTMEVCALWSRLPALYAGVRQALGGYGIVMAHFSHVYREGCSIYFTFAGRGSLAVYDAAWTAALAAAAAAGGTVAHHHGVGQLKQHAAGRELAGVAPMFRALRAQLDPAGILNPGRMFPEQPSPDVPAPDYSVDPVSRVATLPAQEPAEDRDARLLAAGWRLRHPTPGPLAADLGRVAPDDTRVLGAWATVDGHRVALLPVPRSSAGPDPRRVLPPGSYEALTVPIAPTGGD